jgi:hypothetical protein
MRLKSVIARVRKTATHQILGLCTNDGTPLKSVEIQIDHGLAAGDFASGNAIFVEALHVPMGRGDGGRTYPGFTRHRCGGPSNPWWTS